MNRVTLVSSCCSLPTLCSLVLSITNSLSLTRKRTNKQIFEFVLPWIFLVLLVWVRSSLGDFAGGLFTFPAETPTASDVHRPLQFHDYLTALQAQRVCEVQQGGSSLADFLTNCLPGGGGGGGAEAEDGEGLFDGLVDGENATALDGLTVDHLPLFMRQQGVPEDQIALLNNFLPQLVDACVQAGNFVPSRGGMTITGMDSFAWYVPLLKCDATKCTEVGESAEPFCERKMVGLTGDRDRMESFLNWIVAEYPAEEDLQVFRVFDAPEDMDAYVESRFYGRTDHDGTYYPKMAMGIVLDSTDDGDNVWSYQLRPNSTNFNVPVGENDESFPGAVSMPDTSRTTDAYARSEDDACDVGLAEVNPGTASSCVRQYEENGVLTFQRLLHDFILNQTATDGSSDQHRVASVSYVPFPTREYESENFFSYVAGESIVVCGVVWCDVSCCIQHHVYVLTCAISSAFAVFLTLLVTIGLLYPVASMVSYIVKEKQYRQKELMKMMSVSESDIGWSWFVTFFGFHTLTATVTAYLSSRVYLESSLVILWIFWMLTMMASVIFSMTIAAFCSKATRAVLFAVLGFFAGFFLTLAQNVERGRRALILLVSLHPVAAFAYGVSQLSTLEEKSIGLTLENMSFSDSRSGYSFVDTLAMLIVDSVVWGILTWYLNRVITPDYGHALPFYFPFQPSYWLPTSGMDSGRDGNTESAAVANSGIPYETVDDTLDRQSKENKTIEIHSLRKTFGKKNAVDGLSLSMYSGQITALLGHNGE